jgi:hypothetical protein
MRGDRGPRQRIEQRRLPGIRVADQGHGRHRRRLPPLPLLRPDAAHVFQLLLHMADAPVNLSPIGFQLGFTGAAGADAATELRHFHAASRQPRQHVLQLRQLHL